MWKNNTLMYVIHFSLILNFIWCKQKNDRIPERDETTDENSQMRKIHWGDIKKCKQITLYLDKLQDILCVEKKRNYVLRDNRYKIQWPTRDDIR